MLAYHLAVDCHGHHASAAHTGGVHHDRVQAGDGRHAVGLCHLADRAHHQRRADGDHFGDLAAFARLVLLQEVLERRGNEALHPEGAVVGGVDHLQLLAELLLQFVDALALRRPEQQILGAVSRNERDVITHLQMGPHDRVDRRQAHSAGGEHHRLVALVAV